MLHFGDASYEAERWKEELDRIEAGRPIRQALSPRKPRHRLSVRQAYRHLMVRLGNRLVVIGCSLQTRYVSGGNAAACASQEPAGLARW